VTQKIGHPATPEQRKAVGFEKGQQTLAGDQHVGQFSDGGDTLPDDGREGQFSDSVDVDR
jgi:hypothetical protein